MKSDNSQPAITWPDSLEDISRAPAPPGRPLHWKKKLFYAVVLGGIFWGGVLLISARWL